MTVSKCSSYSLWAQDVRLVVIISRYQLFSNVILQQRSYPLHAPDKMVIMPQQAFIITTQKIVGRILLTIIYLLITKLHSNTFFVFKAVT